MIYLTLDVYKILHSEILKKKMLLSKIVHFLFHFKLHVLYLLTSVKKTKKEFLELRILWTFDIHKLQVKRHPKRFALWRLRLA